MLYEKPIKLSSETPEQGLVKEDDNKDDETEEVEDKPIGKIKMILTVTIQYQL